MGTLNEGEQPLGRPIEFFPLDVWKSDDTEMDGRYATLKQRLVVIKVRLDDQSVVISEDPVRRMSMQGKLWFDQETRPQNTRLINVSPRQEMF